MGSELNDEPINISMAQEGSEACVCIVLVTWEVEAGGFFEFSIF